jgi:hypothetical protein
MFIIINKPRIKLYWVTTPDHDEDWFIFADSASSAQAFHEDYEGYRTGDARSRLIVSNVAFKEFENGTPPCHARFQDLYQIGLQARTIPGRRKGRFNGEIFRNGILEAIIEVGRLKKALEYGCVQVEASSSSTAMPGVETGPQLVH